MSVIYLIALVIGAYLFGSISFAIVLARLQGLPDPRSVGSGNPGTTNMLRVGGKKLGILVFIGDCLKGLLPLLLARLWTQQDTILAALGLAAFLGHLYPIFFRFKGGKGVATLLGVFWGLAWPMGLVASLLLSAGVLLTRYVSLAALLMAPLTLLIYSLCMRPMNPITLMTLLTAMSLMTLKHRDNIKRLILGQERKISARTSAKH